MTMRLAAALTALVLIVSPAAAYYHYVHYTSRTSPFNPIQEKFDLNALPNKTVTFFVSDAGPSQLPPNDSFQSVLSQIKQATQVWNSVPTSDLRVAFGGLETVGTPESTPGGDVVFEDLPPGLLAYSGPTSKADVTTGPNGPFVPITRAMMHLNRDLTKRPGPSYMESFFTTVVHEMGHALGLQHTFTSSTMSTAVTRNTTRVRPIDADDIAGISLLYPNRTFATAYGSVTGRVTSGGQPVHLASVVAIRPNGSAISALTNPDGTYRIDGMPPDTYWIYVHPLPPTADIVLPLDPSGQGLAASGPTESLFYPGTRDPQQFAPVFVSRGSTAAGIDFSVQRRGSVPMYDVVVYSFIGQNAISPAFVNTSAPTSTVAARGVGVTSGANTAPGLSVQVLGGIASSGLRAYGAPQTTLAIDLSMPLIAPLGPRHLLFTMPNDMYVLPSGLNLVQKGPPSVLVVSPAPDGSVIINGSNLAADSQFFFDGLPASVRVPFSGNDQFGSVVVTPPPGAGGQHATITVFNSDGQNSMDVQSQNPPTYAYDPSDAPIVSFSPSFLPAGASAMVDVTTANMRLVDGQTTLGFGSNDVFVWRVWVLSPNHLLADVSVAPNAVAGPSQVSLISGFQVFAQPFGFQSGPANPRAPTINLPVVNANPSQTGVYPGAIVSLSGSNLAAAANSTVITLNDQPAPLVSASATQVTFQIPPSQSTGPAILKLSNGTDNAFPVVIQIDSAPPVVTGVLSSSNSVVDALHPVLAGDTVNVLVQGLDPSTLSAPSRLHLNEGGIDLTPSNILQVPGQPSLFDVQVVLSPLVSGSQVPMTVMLDGSSGSQVFIAVRGS